MRTGVALGFHVACWGEGALGVEAATPQQRCIPIARQRIVGKQITAPLNKRSATAGAMAQPQQASAPQQTAQPAAVAYAQPAPQVCSQSDNLHSL